MAQQQQQRDVPQDQLYILNNHPLRLCVAASASIPWTNMYQFWHTLKMDESRFKFKFILDTKELTVTVADFRRIFRLP
ncbi:hypothetical protein Tco_0705130 [Tanacetum coccineum]|uniref:Uncharacterized protein n=1 Tax=Tanacetum coccineum TaxID=301880 RepID=A0ABQ4Y3X4_9ASTR